MEMSSLGPLKKCTINILALAIALLLYRVAKCSCFIFVSCSVFVLLPSLVESTRKIQRGCLVQSLHPNYLPRVFARTDTGPPPSDPSAEYYVFHFQRKKKKGQLLEGLPPAPALPLVTRETETLPLHGGLVVYSFQTRSAVCL